MAKLVKLNGKKWYVRVWLKDQRKYKFIPTNSNNKVDNKRLLKRYNEKEADIVAGLSKSIDEQSIQNAKERWIKIVEERRQIRDISSGKIFEIIYIYFIGY